MIFIIEPEIDFVTIEVGSQYQKKLHSSHFTNRFVLQYVFGFSVSRIPAKDLAAE